MINGKTNLSKTFNQVVGGSNPPCLIHRNAVKSIVSEFRKHPSEWSAFHFV
nr:MAG TPA: hypothetical protein [Caudoviricetes sp.]